MAEIRALPPGLARCAVSFARIARPVSDFLDPVDCRRRILAHAELTAACRPRTLYANAEEYLHHPVVRRRRRRRHHDRRLQLGRLGDRRLGADSTDLGLARRRRGRPWRHDLRRALRAQTDSAIKIAELAKSAAGTAATSSPRADVTPPCPATRTPTPTSPVPAVKCSPTRRRHPRPEQRRRLHRLQPAAQVFVRIRSKFWPRQSPGHDRGAAKLRGPADESLCDGIRSTGRGKFASYFNWLPPLVARLVVGWVFLWSGWEQAERTCPRSPRISAAGTSPTPRS